MFRFKQFTVADALCGMKVGTDGTLLGAWAPLPSTCRTILDVGTGSGLIALMLAQRCPEATVWGIDIDPHATAQAAANFADSPWAERLISLHTPFQDLPDQSFDLIVSNPPYFEDSLKNPDPSRQIARHTDSLPFSDLIRLSALHLSPNGILALILPASAESTILHLAASHQLTPIYITRVHTRAHKPAKRVLLAFQNTSSPSPCTISTPSPCTISSPSPCTISSPSPCTISSLTLLAEGSNHRSTQYATLCQDFYL